MTILGLPADFAQGDTAQLTAKGTWSDGHTEDVTARVRWSSRTPTCVVTPAGLASALQTGSCAIDAALDTVSTEATTTIGPSRTFTIAAVVRERDETHQPPIPGAVLTLTSGAQAGRTVTADALGRFTFASVPSERVTVQVTADGFDGAIFTASPDQPTADVMLAAAQVTYSWSSQTPPGVNVTVPFHVTHRGAGTLTLLSTFTECGTYATFWAWVAPASDPNSFAVLARSPCKAGVPSIGTGDLPPGDYVLNIEVVTGSFSRTLQLSHPR
jgi:hypothetical protein